ncbi:DUF445 domain-containing protein [Allokutzneria oryzae]|uniref:DUF445 domain-containing protein n=1 Tax=Allokutzneria oryzae TaxID=1378989 RepID=A0ABV5ZW78_9PSEU
MKLVALCFLLGATLVFAVTRWQESLGAPGWVGYVRSAAEAGMVGALADWFAVTALFRRPLGLPIPHTAIIPTRKDDLGRNLGTFVETNFLSEDVVRDKLRRVGFSARLGEWLAKPEHADRVTAEAATIVRGAVAVLRDEDVQAVLEQAVLRKIVDRPWGPPLGRLLGQMFADGTHHRLVDLLCDRAHEWVRDHPDAVSKLVSDRAPSWSPKFMDSLLAERVNKELVKFTAKVRADPDHPMREAIDKFLTEFADDLQRDPETMERAEQLKQQVLAHPDAQKLTGSAWSAAKKMLLAAAEDPSSELRKRLRDGLLKLGDRLVSDPALRAKSDGWLEGAAMYVVVNYRNEISGLITETVQRWDAEEASRKIEIQVGRDLQFIRINGTVVGALAGLLIHTVSQILL